mgnify:CR=1 FL=1
MLVGEPRPGLEQQGQLPVQLELGGPEAPRAGHPHLGVDLATHDDVGATRARQARRYPPWPERDRRGLLELCVEPARRELGVEAEACDVDITVGNDQ